MGWGFSANPTFGCTTVNQWKQDVTVSGSNIEVVVELEPRAVQKANPGQKPKVT